MGLCHPVSVYVYSSLYAFDNKHTHTLTDPAKLDAIFAGIGVQFATEARELDASGGIGEGSIILVSEIAAGGPACRDENLKMPHLEIGDEVLKIEDIPVFLFGSISVYLSLALVLARFRMLSRALSFCLCLCLCLSLSFAVSSSPVLSLSLSLAHSLSLSLFLIFSLFLLRSLSFLNFLFVFSFFFSLFLSFSHFLLLSLDLCLSFISAVSLSTYV